MTLEEIFPGVFKLNGRLATKSFAPKTQVYGERLVQEKGVEYRLWEPSRSKLGAAMVKGLKAMPIAPGAKVLYLGAASGTTASHVSDIVGKQGSVFCVEFSARSMRDLIFVCETRQNMVPLLADARKTWEYESEVGEKVDAVFEDVADPQQAEILEANCKTFLKKGGIAMIAIKARSVDSTRNPNEIFLEVENRLAQTFEIMEKLDLAPFEQDHEMLVLKFKTAP